MKRENEFRSWLERGGAKSPNARNTRVSTIRSLERKLEELGIKFQDLDTAWNADRFKSLSERLR